LITIHSGISVHARKHRVARGMFSQNQVIVSLRREHLYNRFVA